MSDRCKKSTKLSVKKKKLRRCHLVINEGSNSTTSNAIIKNQMATTMQKFCIDSNIMLNTARKCSLTGNKKKQSNLHVLYPTTKQKKKRKENKKKDAR